MKSKVTWVLVADKAVARIVENRGRGTGLRQLAGKTRYAEKPLEFADEEGRGAHSGSTSHYKMSKHTEGLREDEEFAKSLMEDIEKSHHQGKFDQLIICAAPAMLGILRRYVPIALKSDVAVEVAKDLTSIPTDDLAEHFSDVIRL